MQPHVASGELNDSRQMDFTELPDFSDEEEFDIDEMILTETPDTKNGEGVSLNLASVNFFQRFWSFVNFRASIAVLLWYLFSIALSVYNKNMFSQNGMDFHFPILTTSFHQLFQSLMAVLALHILKLPLQGPLKGHKLRYAAAFASSGDIGLANVSLLLVTLSFYTMIKSTALGFVLLFSVIFGLESATWRLMLIVFVMSCGVLMMVLGEHDFSLGGFFLVLSASCCSGLRWVLIKLLLDQNTPDIGKTSAKAHPVQAILAMSPSMFVCLLIWGLIVEGPKQFVTAPLWSQHSVVLGIFFLLFPAILAFCMIWAEFELINATGPLTMAVAGICKEMATVCTSILVFHDKLTVVNGLGVLVTTISIGMYHVYRMSS